MDDAVRMRLFEGLRDLDQKSPSPRRTGSARVLAARRVCVPGNELEHEVVDSSTLLEAVNGGDVGMVQRRENSCFALKAFEASSANASGKTLTSRSSFWFFAR